MTDFIDYIETSCRNLKDNHMTYLYKKSLLDRMTERANEMTQAGLRNEKVIADLISDEFGDLENGYPNFVKEEKRRQRAQLLKFVLPVGGIIAFILIFIAYFTVSRFTLAWDKTWLIIVGGIFAMIIFYLSFAIRKLCRMQRVFHPIARVLIAGCVMLFMVFVFLFWLMMLPDNIITWPIIPGGIILVLISDLLFAYATKQKFRTVSLLVYMLIIATMLYIIFAAYGVVTWVGGWPIILLGLLADLVYILVVFMGNMKYFMYRQEVEE